MFLANTGRWNYENSSSLWAVCAETLQSAWLVVTLAFCFYSNKAAKHVGESALSFFKSRFFSSLGKDIMDTVGSDLV
jgi:hypothetical protein